MSDTPASTPDASSADGPAAEPPAWKTPEASGLPPAWQDPDGAADAAPASASAGAFGGLIPEDRPEVLLGAALAGGALTAIVLRTLVRR